MSTIAPLAVQPAAFRAGPMPRHPVGADDWEAAAGELAQGRLSLLGLWGDAAACHMALMDPATHGIALLTHEGAAFPSVGRLHAPAQRPERAAADLFGLNPEGAPDPRPWLDHGRWDVRHPLGAATAGQGPLAYPFLPVEGESLHEVPVGPVHAGIIEPGHFRFTAQGETVVRLETRLGYAHKGVEGLMRGATPARGAVLAGRCCGDSTVAYAWAFAQAVEAALGAEIPARALALRALMAEMERLANHLGDIGAACNDAAFAMMHAQTSLLREQVLRAADTAFGHRLLRDRVLPGGVAHDLAPEGAAAIGALGDAVRARFPALVRLYDGTASLQDRTVGTGILAPALAARFGAGGYVGRASGRDFDARRDLPYAPYDRLAPAVATAREGDVDARLRIRIREVETSLQLIDDILRGLPPGPIRAELPDAGAPREGLGIVEGFRGDILAWVALDARGCIRRCHLRDPSWFHWPLIEAAIEGNIIADFPLINKSFNCAYSGHDL